VKILLKYLHHRPSVSFVALLERQMETLGQSLQADEARVVVELRLQASPPFRICARLSTSGPEVVAEAAGHTLWSVLLAVGTQLERAIELRKASTVRRVRRKLQSNAASRPAIVAAAQSAVPVRKKRTAIQKP